MDYKLKIFKMKEIDLTNINYCIPIKFKNQIVIPLTYRVNNSNKRTPLFIQIPELYLNGISQQDLLILPLLSKNNQLTEGIVKFLLSLDEKIQGDLRSIIQRTRKYFPNDNWTKKFIYSAIVHTIEDEHGDIDKSYMNGALKLLMKHNGQHTIKVFNADHELLSQDCNINDYVGSYVSSIVELNSIVIDDCNICVYIRPHQLKLSQPIIKNYKLEEYSFIDSESDEQYQNSSKNNLLVSTITEYFDDRDEQRGQINELFCDINTNKCFVPKPIDRVPNIYKSNININNNNFQKSSPKISEVYENKSNKQPKDDRVQPSNENEEVTNKIRIDPILLKPIMNDSEYSDSETIDEDDPELMDQLDESKSDSELDLDSEQIKQYFSKIK